MDGGDDDGAITSMSKLLAPSASSTNRPSRSNYGASDDDSVSRNDSAASFELLLPRQSKLQEGSLKAKIQRHCRSRPALATAIILTLLGLVALVTALALPDSGVKPGDQSGAKKHGLEGSERPPFSTLDPVKDLGLYPLSRPQDSSPPKSLLRDTPQQAVPTNMWYQNLLLAKGEPTDVHRAYPMPYVVDSVGPIPGLRAHPNHFDSSTTVVQLSFVASHGLTLGAAVADSSQSEPLSKRYSVVSTTALAVTLEWVSGRSLCFVSAGISIIRY